MTHHDWERPIDRAETAHACLTSITQLVASCEDMNTITTNEFSQLLGLVKDQLRGSLDALREEIAAPGERPLDAAAAGRA